MHLSVSRLSSAGDRPDGPTLWLLCTGTDWSTAFLARLRQLRNTPSKSGCKPIQRGLDLTRQLCITATHSVKLALLCSIRAVEGSEPESESPSMMVNRGVFSARESE